MLSENEIKAAVSLMIYCTAALISFSDSIKLPDIFIGQGKVREDESRKKWLSCLNTG